MKLGRIIGIDPGLRNTGIAILEVDDTGRARCLAVRYMYLPPSKNIKDHGLRMNADDLDRVQKIS